jgi:hypothetical protein
VLLGVELELALFEDGGKVLGPDRQPRRFRGGGGGRVERKLEESPAFLSFEEEDEGDGGGSGGRRVELNSGVKGMQVHKAVLRSKGRVLIEAGTDEM